jgi:hypothetical protein
VRLTQKDAAAASQRRHLAPLIDAINIRDPTRR